jgi:hypothetical protein
MEQTFGRNRITTIVELLLPWKDKAGTILEGVHEILLLGGVYVIPASAERPFLVTAQKPEKLRKSGN